MTDCSRGQVINVGVVVGMVTDLVLLPESLQERFIGREVFPEALCLCGQQSLLLQDPAVLHAMVVSLLLQTNILLLRESVS